LTIDRGQLTIVEYPPMAWSCFWFRSNKIKFAI